MPMLNRRVAIVESHQSILALVDRRPQWSVIVITTSQGEETWRHRLDRGVDLSGGRYHTLSGMPFKTAHASADLHACDRLIVEHDSLNRLFPPSGCSIRTFDLVIFDAKPHWSPVSLPSVQEIIALALCRCPDTRVLMRSTGPSFEWFTDAITAYDD